METAALWIGVMIAFTLGMLVENRLHKRREWRNFLDENRSRQITVLENYAAHDVKLTMDLYKNVPPEHFRHEPPIFDFIKTREMPTKEQAEQLKAAVLELEHELTTSDITNGELFLSNHILATDVVDTGALGGWISDRAKAMSISLIVMLIPEFNGQRIVWYPGNINEAEDLDIPNS